LTLAEIAAAARFAGLHQRTLSFHVGKCTAALHDDEAVALLYHQSQDRHRGTQLTLAQLGPPRRLGVFLQRDGAQRLVATLE